ncbi:MAG: hypothetical protein HY828_22130 [Actinobacteria bacterium]|nr:hypothetical protein [Actinomycetota bacterium]
MDATQPATATPWPYAILEWHPEDSAPPVVQEVLARVRANTQRLRQIIASQGWPGRDLVGEDGADAAWLILQHAGGGVTTLDTTENRQFRRDCVPLLEAAVCAGQAHPRHLAHLVDGIQAVEGADPVYGVLGDQYTVVDGHPVFARSVDHAALDARRSAIGLAPLSTDVARRERGEDIPAIGPDQVEPWPTPGRPGHVR